MSELGYRTVLLLLLRPHGGPVSKLAGHRHDCNFWWEALLRNSISLFFFTFELPDLRRHPVLAKPLFLAHYLPAGVDEEVVLDRLGFYTLAAKDDRKLGLSV